MRLLALRKRDEKEFRESKSRGHFKLGRIKDVSDWSWSSRWKKKREIMKGPGKNENLKCERTKKKGKGGVKDRLPVGSEISCYNSKRRRLRRLPGERGKVTTGGQRLPLEGWGTSKNVTYRLGKRKRRGEVC